MSRTKNLITYLGIALASACSSNPSLDFECEDGTCDVDSPDSVVDAHPCDGRLLDASGRQVEHTVNRLGDAFVEKVFKQEAEGDGIVPCPTDFDQVVAKLKKTDSDNCRIETFVVSEQGQILDKDGFIPGEDGEDDVGEIGYRAVTSRACDGRDQSDFVFSAFGFNNKGPVVDGEENPMDITASGLPSDVEIIAFDETQGVFNYYKALGLADGSQAFFFFGNSKDFLDKSPEGPGLTDIRGCGNCHTSGGLIMKELDSPWIHWQPDVSGGRELVANRSDAMGSMVLGEFLESRVVEPGNEKWNGKKIEHLKENGQVGELLRPLFCPTDFNIQTGNKGGISDNFLFDPILVGDFQFTDANATAEANNSLSFGLQGSDYDNIINHFEQDNEGISEDLARPFSFVERSFADGDYIQQLVAAGVIDGQLVTDILMVDFTRPLHSNSRCGIMNSLSEVVLNLDDLPSDQTPPDAIRDALIDALDGSSSGSPEGQLLGYLEASKANNPADHQATLDAYSAACESRKAEKTTIQVFGEDDETSDVEVSSLHLDAMKLRSLQRKLVFGHDGILDLDEIIAATAGASAAAESSFGEVFALLRNVAFKPASLFEFDGALPSDQVEIVEGGDSSFELDADSHLSPIDCTLQTGFIPVASAE